MRKGRHSRFTLIELLVVVVIIGIISALLLPALAMARWRGKNTVCVNNLKQMAMGFTAFAGDYDGNWPYRPATAFNHFQRGEIGDQPRPDGFRNQEGDSAFSLVNQVGPYLGNTRPFRDDANGFPYRQTVMYDGAYLGPTFVCPLHQPQRGTSGVASWNGRSKHGTHHGGLADTNGGGNDNHFMSYNWYARGGSWRDVFVNVKKTGMLIDFGMIYRGREYPDVLDSNLLFSDMVRGKGGAGDHVDLLHKPRPGSRIEYRTDGHHNGPINNYFRTYGSFDQNNCYQDGSVSGSRGLSTNIAPTHSTNRSGNLITIQTE